MQRHLHRAAAAIAAGCALTIAGSAFAQAQNWPTRPVRIISPFAPGNPGEFLARLLQEPLAAALKQPVVVENRPGAGGNIGAEAMVRANDGHTFVVTTDTVLTVNPHVYRQLPFNQDDLVPVTQLVTVQLALVCHPSFPAKDFAGFLAHVRKTRINYASGGPGVPGHLAMEMLAAQAELTMVHIPYKGPAPAMQDILAGQVACGFLASPVVLPQARAGKLTAFAVSSTQRSLIAPDLPTVAEAGYPRYDASFSELIVAPRDTPPAVIARLQSEIAKVLASPAIIERVRTSDMVPLASSPADAQAWVRRTSERWRDLVRRINLQLD